MTKLWKRAAWMLCVLAVCVGSLGVPVRAAEAVRAEIPVEITLSGSAPQTAEVYTVELVPEDGTCPMPEGTGSGCYTMDLTGTQSGCLALEFERPGVYCYTLRQRCGDRADCGYDDRAYHLSVYVTNNDSGGYDLSVVAYREQENSKRAAISFENYYAVPATAVITAGKTLDGKAPKDGAFTFQLAAQDGTVVGTAKNLGGSVTFDALTFDREGTYRYRLRELAGTDKTVIYDESIYDVTVTVALDGDYTATVSYSKDGKPLDGTPVFANLTKAQEPTKTDNPKTGDRSQIALWAGLMALSLAGGTAVLLLSRRGRRG